jgi:hypothetical protein
MATKKSSTKASTVPIRKVEAFVKKDMAALRADAKRLSDFLKSAQSGPERLSIKICDCCIKIE